MEIVFATHQPVTVRVSDRQHTQKSPQRELVRRGLRQSPSHYELPVALAADSRIQPRAERNSTAKARKFLFRQPAEPTRRPESSTGVPFPIGRGMLPCPTLRKTEYLLPRVSL